MKITYKLKYAVQEAQRNGYMAVTSKAQNGEIRIVPIMEILIKPIGSVVGQDSRYNLKYNLKYNLEPIKAIGFKALMKRFK
ncbi:MAG: hypothetical protein ACLVKZ_07970 [[Eubacterium] siraeum]